MRFRFEPLRAFDLMLDRREAELGIDVCAYFVAQTQCDQSETIRSSGAGVRMRGDIEASGASTIRRHSEPREEGEPKLPLGLDSASA